MSKVALITDAESLPIDYDMPPLLDACLEIGLDVEVCNWDDPKTNWKRFDAAVLRSPWTYTRRYDEFIAWFKSIEKSLEVVQNAVTPWGLDKYYLRDINRLGVPIIPSEFVAPQEDPLDAINRVFLLNSYADEVVIKPTIGAYSKDVGRYAKSELQNAIHHLSRLLNAGRHAIVQPYLTSLDDAGEIDLIFFDGKFSHSIGKKALLMADGTVHVPTEDFRSHRTPTDAELTVAKSAVDAAATHLDLGQPLVYARVDLVKDRSGNPVVLEMEMCEPSLNLPFDECSALRFAQAIERNLVTRSLVCG